MIHRLQTAIFLGALLFLAWLPSSSFAGVAASSAFDKFMWTATGGASQTVGFSSSGTPVLSPSTPIIDTDGGLPRVSTSGQLKNPSGNPFSVSASGRIPGLEVAKAVGRYAAAFTGYLGVGILLYDLFKEMGYDSVRLPDGSVSVTKPTYTTWYNNYQQGARVYTSASAACKGLGFAGAGTVAPSGSYPAAAGCIGGDGYFAFVPPDQTPVAVPSTIQQLQDEIASKSGWPSTSKISEVLADPRSSAGEKIKTDPASNTVTGPATSPGKVETKREVKADGTTVETTKTTTHDHKYTGPTVNTTTSTVTQVKTCTGAGSCSTNTETTTTQPDPVEDYSASDTPLPQQPKLYEQKYKDGLTGVWRDRKAEFNQSPLLQLSKNMMPTIGASSGYPSWPIGIKIGPWDFGTYDVSPAGYVWDFLKVCVIVSSLFLARKLIFGG